MASCGSLECFYLICLFLSWLACSYKLLHEAHIYECVICFVLATFFEECSCNFFNASCCALCLGAEKPSCFGGSTEKFASVVSGHLSLKLKLENNFLNQLDDLFKIVVQCPVHAFVCQYLYLP